MRNWLVASFGSPAQLALLAIVVAAGTIALRFLDRTGAFRIVRKDSTLLGIAPAAAGAAVFTVIAIAADLSLRFPRDLNVPLPGALLFYPFMGLAAECVFHVIPLAVLVSILRPEAAHAAGRMVAIYVVVALLEPTFQVAVADDPAAPTSVFTGIHVFVIGLFELWLFRRHDFVTMFGFRMLYYLGWHIAWGTLRLG